MEPFLAVMLFISICLALLIGFPVAFTIAGLSLVFACLGALLGVFDLAILQAFPSRIFGVMTNATLFAVPLFILMGVILERAQIARDLLDSLGRVFAKSAGGLALAVTFISALLAASTGIVGATVITMGLLALPIMLERGYDKSFASGTIATAGTLGVIIPPSILLILLGDILSSAYAHAQREMGHYAAKAISVGDLFAGALLPGIALTCFYMIYQKTRATLNPNIAPAPQKTDDVLEIGMIIKSLIAPIALILIVLGSILIGLATPSEASAIGAIGAALIAAQRQEGGGKMIGIIFALIGFLLLLKGLVPETNLDWANLGGASLEGNGFFNSDVAPNGVLLTISNLLASLSLAVLAFYLMRIFHLLWKAGILSPCLHTTARMTAMVMTILICASLFSLVFRGFEGDDLIHRALSDLPGGKWTAFTIVMIAIFLLGFILDFIEISFVVVPIVAPILIILGFDPIWLGVMIAMNLQTSFLTPPFGFALFYLRGVAPPSITTKMIYKGVIPFILIQIGAMFVIALFPDIALWLPRTLFP